MISNNKEHADPMRKKSKALYGISRIDDDTYRTHAWRVSLRRYGKTHVKNFPDLKHGGKRKALRAAKEYRDWFVSTHPPMTRKAFADVLRVNNTSGIPGVYKYRKTYYLKDGTERERWYWEAHWPTAPGESDKACFAVHHYGENRARQLAIRARKEGLKRVEGVFWASRKGVAVQAHAA